MCIPHPQMRNTHYLPDVESLPANFAFDDTFQLGDYTFHRHAIKDHLEEALYNHPLRLGAGETARHQIKDIFVFNLGRRRAVGETVAECDPALGVPPITGFSNHGGGTRLGPAARPLGYDAWPQFHLCPPQSHHQSPRS